MVVTFIDSFTTTVRKVLKQGDDVTLTVFRSFKVAKRTARVGVNAPKMTSLACNVEVAPERP